MTSGEECQILQGKMDLIETKLLDPTTTKDDFVRLSKIKRKIILFLKKANLEQRNILLALPLELKIIIFSNIPFISVVRLRQVCHYLRSLIDELIKL
jgi:hypothetical protein